MLDGEGASADQGTVELSPILVKEGSGSGRDDMDEVETQVEVNESNHRFYCDGKLVRGPSEGSCDIQLMFVGIYLFAILAYAALGGVLLSQYYPGLFVLPLMFICLDFVAFLICGFIDPGVVPPKPDVGEAATIPPSVRFCKTCNIKQEDGCRHCSYCNACVRELDHHCGIVGTCIGARNKVHFAMMLFYYMTSFLSFVVGIVYAAMTTVIRQQSDFDGTFPQAMDTSAFVFTIIMAVVLVVSLLVYFLAAFGYLNEGWSEFVFRYLCCMPGGLHGSFLHTRVPRERVRCCGVRTCLTFPKREFYLPTTNSIDDS